MRSEMIGLYRYKEYETFWILQLTQELSLYNSLLGQISHVDFPLKSFIKDYKGVLV